MDIARDGATGKNAQCPEPESCTAFSVTWSGKKTQSLVGYFELTNSLTCSWLYSESTIRKQKERKKKKERPNQLSLHFSPLRLR